MSELILGVIGVEDLAAALRSPVAVMLPGGVQAELVAVEGSVDEVIRKLLESESPFPVFLHADSIGVLPRLLEATPLVVVVGTDQAQQGAVAVATPATVGDLIRKLPIALKLPENLLSVTVGAPIPAPVAPPTNPWGDMQSPAARRNPAAALSAWDKVPQPIPAGNWDEQVSASASSPSPSPAVMPVAVHVPAPQMVSPDAVQAPAVPARAAARYASTTPARGFGDDDENLASLFSPVAMTNPQHRPDTAQGNAQVIVVWGGRGGIGKSSTSHALAATAAARGVRTVLVDGNDGQGDQRLLLGIPPQVASASIFDAAITGNPEAAVLSPKQIALLRPGRSTQPQFALVAAPPSDLADDPRMTPQVYLDTVRHLTKMSDLVIVDTQILESKTKGMFEGFILPLLLSHAWGLGISNGTVPGLVHLSGRLNHFQTRGIQPGRQLFILNAIDDKTELDVGVLARKLDRVGRFVGVMPYDSDIVHLSNAGEMLLDTPALSHWIETILSIVVGTPVTSEQMSHGPVKRSLFGRAKARK